MNFLITFFNTVLYQPLLNILILLYAYLPFHDFGIAIIVFTLIIRLALSPLSLSAARSQKVMAELQPKIKEIQKKYKEDAQKQSQALLELYQKEKINPFSSLLPLLLQLPIFIALYQIFLNGIGENILGPNLYSFVPHFAAIELTFLGAINLSKPSFLLAFLAGVFQFIQSKISFSMTKSSGGKEDGKEKFAQIMQTQVIYVLPFITFFFLLHLGSLISLYWATSSLFSCVEQYIIKAQSVKCKV
ncbi:YidC/Oxa1 family membrane protein insertase [Patescibacteria group bacterium]|nr:YidC/Oxa1 family membrane protein insertase [Patescibacteria group bacterium]